ncbi:aldo/keto reductase [Paenibacillus sp. FSL L8-0436]|uniref:aldo/keto reductase n=1 Tax=Paenibacillus sp. FSL L8-0436 TaxID=2954686 RepID=UPI0031587E8E
MAVQKGCTTSQLALAWLLAQGDNVVPIPGTKRLGRVKKNLGALQVSLSAEELAQIESISPKGAVAGGRFPGQN